MIKLGQRATDSATNLEGFLTIYYLGDDNAESYCLQPCGTNPDTGASLPSLWVSERRIRHKDHQTDSTPMPKSVLGTIVKDQASGFNGIAIAIKYYLNGCIHFTVQPKGAQKSGEAIATEDFDIRRLTGLAITAMTESEKDKSQRENPSPLSSPPRRY